MMQVSVNEGSVGVGKLGDFSSELVLHPGESIKFGLEGEIGNPMKSGGLPLDKNDVLAALYNSRVKDNVVAMAAEESRNADYQTGKSYANGWHSISCDKIEAIIMVREGAIIPHIKKAQSTKDLDWSNIELVAYTTGNDPMAKDQPISTATKSQARCTRTGTPSSLMGLDQLPKRNPSMICFLSARELRP